jgi:chromosome segregation ATPase
MPNTKKPSIPGPINDSDKQTLSGVGIDVSDTPLRSEEDEATGVGDLSEQAGEKIVDIDGTTPSSNDVDVEKTGIKFVKEESEVNKEDLSSLAESRMKASAEDLEKEFESELGETKIKAPLNEDAVLKKSETLAELLARIEKKLNTKKTSVKEELSNLKKMKDTISHDIGEIKDLEASEQKIKEEMKKIDSIREEVESIEEELNDKV